MNGLPTTVDAELGVLWVESEQISHLKVGCTDFGLIRGSAIYPTYIILGNYKNICTAYFFHKLELTQLKIGPFIFV